MEVCGIYLHNRYKVMSVIALLMRMKFSRFPAKDKSEKHFHQYVCPLADTTKIIIKTIKATLCVARDEASAPLRSECFPTFRNRKTDRSP